MRALVAAFSTTEAIKAGADRAKTDGFPVLDALTPFPVPELLDRVGKPSAGVRVPMALAGFGVAIAAYGFQWWTAVYAYPYNSGGRPLDSWPVFILVPFEVGILAAAVAGLVAFLFGCGFPRLNHSFFAVPGTNRVTADRFFLLLDPLEPGKQASLARLLLDAGALSVSEVEG